MKLINNTLTIILVFIMIAVTPVRVTAQNRLTRLWTGLRIEQPDSMKPHGKSPFQVPQQKERKHSETRLVRGGDLSWTILDGWEMTDQKTFMESEGVLSNADFVSDTNWYDAVVPGTVLTTLVANGVYPDPYYGLNNMAIPETLCRTEWWFRTVFDMPDNSSGESHILFDGINYRSEIYLNGKFVGNTYGAFTSSDFNVNALIKPKGNVLCVHVYPPSNPGIPHEQSVKAGGGANGGMLSLDGPTFISSIGWDWMPGIRDRNTGIWQNVRLKKYGGVKIDNILVKTDLPIPDTSYTDISLDIELVNLYNTPQSGELGIKFADRNFSLPYNLAPLEKKTFCLKSDKYKELHLENPQLWWPNGYGRQDLYQLELQVGKNGEVSDKKTVNFGVRELSYELMAFDGNTNSRFLYTPNDAVSNKPVFDYETRKQISKDLYVGSIRKGSDTSALCRLPQDDPVGPYIVFRVNGRRIFCRGGNWGMDDAMKNCSMEHLEPYFALHKAANFNMIRNWTGESTEEVFYDLCDRYGMLVWNDFWITTDDTVEPNDISLFIENVKQTVRRFRNHPSIAVWCPRNEGYAPRDMADTLQNTVNREDPTRHYHGQSRYLNMNMSGPWGEQRNRTRYYTELAKGFTTEIGSISFPTANTVRKFIAPEDLWPINDVWSYHDVQRRGMEIKRKVDSYGTTDNFDDFARKAQMICYESWRCMTEAWNSHMWNSTTGLILWMSHPAWTSLRSQVYTYDYETPGAYYAVKKGFERIHIQATLPDRHIVCVNNTDSCLEGLTAEVVCYNTDAKMLSKESHPVTIDARSSVKVFDADTTGKPEMYLMRTILKDRKGKCISINDYWIGKNDQDNARISEIPAATVSIKKSDDKITVRNTSSYIAVAVRLSAYDDNGKQILPALFTDGYFNLLPNETRTISVSVPFHNGNFNVRAEGYNVR